LNTIESLWWDFKKVVTARKPKKPQKNITELEVIAHEGFSETRPEVGVWLYISFAAGHNCKRVFH